MPEPIERYIPQKMVGHFRVQAFKVWGLAVALVFIWVLLIVAAPVAAGNEIRGLSDPIYNFFSYICHQMADRSFHAAGHKFAVCNRCFGVYFGLLVGLATYPLWRAIESIEPLPRFWLFLALIPIGLDWSLTMFGIWENNTFTRFVTGLILGIACAVFITPALIEITRNFSMRWRSSRLSHPN